MKRCLLLILLATLLCQANAQVSNYFHEGNFRKRVGMSSNPYKPDDWEKPYMDAAIKSAFPPDLIKTPEEYRGKPIHLIGIIDSAIIDLRDDSTHLSFLLENKYWDYIEDYSIQDEKMFVSPMGGGKFRITLSFAGKASQEDFINIAKEKTLFLVYGDFQTVAEGIPVIAARQIKYIDYKWYTTTAFSYDIKRDKKGLVVTDKKGNVEITDFHFLKVPGRGQNK
jgi:hypothetical protein